MRARYPPPFVTLASPALRQALREWRFPTTREAIRAYAATPTAEDAVALKSATNAIPIALLLRERAGRVVVPTRLTSRSLAVRGVTARSADARVLADLLRTDRLPEAPVPDEEALSLKAIAECRADLVRQRGDARKRVNSILARNVVVLPADRDLYGTGGRAYLESLDLPRGEGFLLRQQLLRLDFLEEQIAMADLETT